MATPPRWSNLTLRQVSFASMEAWVAILLDADEPDLLRHGPAMPPVAGPEESIDVPAARNRCFPGSEVRVVDGVDT